MDGRPQLAAFDPVPPDEDDDEEPADEEVEVEAGVEAEAAGAADVSFALDDEALSAELAVLRLSVR